ncbi:cell division protein ZapA [Alkalicoccus urumqiensis]|uniref:cell division protein ZapA n=1 Tax=Alkalicoccus urumqiensis TaxID=1548213 RepID=UPI0015E61AB6|nr:cell division protein ZapA [Alkalicoccus urumqiensis]
MDHEEEKIRTKVKIGRQTYTVVGTESAEHVQEAAQAVDDKLQELRRTNPYVSPTQLAVLAALNISSDYLALQKETKKKEEDDS